MVSEKGRAAALKAWRTRRKNDQTTLHSAAAKKAWKTMRKQESEMTDAQRKALHRKRSLAAKKAWETIRAS